MPLQIAVCGAGAFGRNHIRIYRELEAAGAPIHLAAVVEPDPARVADISPSVAVFPSVEALLAAQGELRIDAASVCSPTSSHYPVTAALLQGGVHVLVEKPIAATLDEADALIALAREHDRTLTVGHLERFNPAVQACLPLLRGPMFFESHRLSVFSPRSLDTDVVLDLMIHDLDIVLTLVQSPVTGVHAVGLPILSGRTDIANVRVEFASGCVANFTASRVSTERVRKLRFFQPHQYLSLDYARQDLLVIEVQPKVQSEVQSEIQSQIQPGASHPSAELPTLGMNKPPIATGEPLRLEIEAFLQAIQTRSAPHVTGDQARSALALALQIQEAIAAHARHAGLQAFTR